MGWLGDALGFAAGGGIIQANNELFKLAGIGGGGDDGNGIGDWKTPTAIAPDQNPSLKKTLANQIKTAEDYRANIPEQGNKLYSQFEGQERQNLKQNLKNVDTSYNRRGLLRSGMRTGAQFGEQAKSAGNLASARSGINSQLMSNADQLDTNAYNTAGAMSGMGLGLGNAIAGAGQAGLNASNNYNQGQQGFYNNLGQTGGLAGAMAYNNYKRTPSTGGYQSGSANGMGDYNYMPGQTYA